MPKQTFLNLSPNKRAGIEAAAIAEFAEHGYQSASISRIVERAGIAKGSFYQYFEDKQDLFMHLVDLATQEKKAFFRDRQPPDASIDFFRYLHWLFEAGYAYAAVQSKLNQAVSRVLFGEGLFMEETFRQMQNASTQMLLTLIHQAIQRGDITPAVDPAVSAFVIETLLNGLGVFILSQQQVGPEDLRRGSLDWLHSARAQEMADHLLYVLEHGLGNSQREEKDNEH